MSQTQSNPRHYSLSDKDTWQTPQETVDDFREALGTIDLDPCAGAKTSHAKTNYRLEDGDDGLEQPWFGNVFINPPFSHKKKWLKKLEEELETGRVECAIMLTPDATDTKSWWHKYVAENAKYICFRYGRLDYVNPDPDGDDPGATFGTAFSVYGDHIPTDLIDVLSDKGHVVKTVDSV